MNSINFKESLASGALCLGDQVVSRLQVAPSDLCETPTLSLDMPCSLGLLDTMSHLNVYLDSFRIWMKHLFLQKVTYESTFIEFHYPFSFSLPNDQTFMSIS